MIKDKKLQFYCHQQSHAGFGTGIAIILFVLAFNLVGNGLRDALNVKGKIITRPTKFIGLQRHHRFGITRAPEAIPLGAMLSIAASSSAEKLTFTAPAFF